MATERVKFPLGMRLKILKKRDGCCYLCGDAIDIKLPRGAPKSFEVDHVVPISKGGSNDLPNLEPACFSCNRAKRELPVSVAKQNILQSKWKTSRIW